MDGRIEEEEMNLAAQSCPVEGLRSTEPDLPSRPLHPMRLPLIST